MSVEQVIARLQAIDRRLPEQDGVRWFNELYLHVTEGVQARLKARGFEDHGFIERLDEVFADLYLHALDSHEKAWTPLLRARTDRGIAPGRFMLAGVNAHVNYDLPIALVQSRQALGGELRRDTPRHRDFQRIDAILSDVEEQMHKQLGTGHLKRVIALWGVIRARERAWDTATDLAVLDADSETRSRYLCQLAGMVADWSKLLLHMPA